MKRAHLLGAWLLAALLPATADAQPGTPAPGQQQEPAPAAADALAPHLHQSGAAHLAVSNAVAVRGAVDWLVNNQNKDGSWGGPQSPRPIEIMADVPGGHNAFRVATTGLCVMALAQSPQQNDASRDAYRRGVDALLAQHEVKRPSLLEHYSVWAFGYGLQALAEHLLAFPDDPRNEQVRGVCQRLIDKLLLYQALDGGWGYLSLQEVKTFKPSFTSMSFTTATCLIGLHRAQRAGIELPAEMLRKALNSVARCETGIKAFTYGELWRNSPMLTSVNHLKGAACRGPVCLDALACFDRPAKPERYRHALKALLVDHARFQIAGLRRPMPHESHYGVSGYFYLYGHYYAALLLERLDATDRAHFDPLLERATLLTRQPDGSFWDYPLYSYHKPYGTAYALLILARTHQTQG